MSIVYNRAKGLNGNTDWDTDDIRARLCMTNTSANTDKDADTVADITTLDECDDTSYAIQALANEVVTIDDTNDKATHGSDNVTFTLAGDGARDLHGVLFVEHVDGSSGDLPICYCTLTGQPISKATSPLTIANPSSGWMRLS